MIHTVGPVYSPSDDHSSLLASCDKDVLRVADEFGAATVAFPAISTGAYGYPVEAAASVAIRTVAHADTQVCEVRFVLFERHTYDAFLVALNVVTLNS